MGRLRLAVLLSIISAVALLPWGKAQVQQGQTATIIGEIRVERGGSPNNRIEITLQAHGLVVATAFSDGAGNFSFGRLDENLYHVIVQPDNYQPVDIQLLVNPLFSTVYHVNVSLRPKPQEKAANEMPVAGGNPNLVGTAEYKQHYPRDAIKEFEKGVKAERNKKMEDATRHYQRAVQMAPQFYEARNNLGLAYLAKRDFNDAQKQFEDVIRINPADTEAYFNVGNVFLLTNRLPEAGRVVRQGLQRQPNSAFGKFLLGSIYSRAGNEEEAEKLLEQCLQLDSTMSKAHLALVNIYLQEHRTEPAIAQLKAFLKSSPNDPLTPRVKQVLRQLQNNAGSSGSSR